MKKQNIKTLKLTRRVVSKISDLDKTVGGTDSFGRQECMEDFTLGCSPTFNLECPHYPTYELTEIDTCSAPQNCW